MLTVNLFDSEFEGQVSMVRGRTPRHIEYVRGQWTWDGITVFTDRQIFLPSVMDVRSPVKIAWLIEPRGLRPHYYDQIPGVEDLFDLILTYDQKLLARGSKYAFVPGGGVWIPDREWGMRRKSKLCSFLIGNKMATEGHRFRHEVADEVAFGVDFYGVLGKSTTYGPDTKLEVLRDYAFSIVIENTCEPNYFDEWLLDCLSVGTIPLYWGCPNIGEFFACGGILPFASAAHCRTLVESLSWDLYERLWKAASHNLKRVPDYACIEDWIFENILQGVFA